MVNVRLGGSIMDDLTDGSLGVPQEGAIFSFSPAKLTVTVGGNNAYAA